MSGSTRFLMKWIWVGAGWLSLGMGIIGVFLPVMPTTPFVLLAAFCFSKGSRRWHAWLRQHPRFGGLIRDWEANGAIRTPAKIMATALIIPLFTFTLIFICHVFWIRILLATVGLSVLAFIWSRPGRANHPGALETAPDLK